MIILTVYYFMKLYSCDDSITNKARFHHKQQLFWANKEHTVSPISIWLSFTGFSNRQTDRKIQRMTEFLSLVPWFDEWFSTSIDGTDIGMSILILEFGKNKTAKNSEILVAFRIFFHFFNTPYGWKIRARYAKRHNQVGHTFVQVGHTYVQAEYIGWTYVCPTL